LQKVFFLKYLLPLYTLARFDLTADGSGSKYFLKFGNPAQLNLHTSHEMVGYFKFLNTDSGFCCSPATALREIGSARAGRGTRWTWSQFYETVSAEIYGQILI
jgi:hypothetical protein